MSSNSFSSYPPASTDAMTHSSGQSWSSALGQSQSSDDQEEIRIAVEGPPEVTFPQFESTSSPSYHSTPMAHSDSIPITVYSTTNPPTPTFQYDDHVGVNSPAQFVHVDYTQAIYHGTRDFSLPPVPHQRARSFHTDRPTTAMGFHLRANSDNTPSRPRFSVQGLDGSAIEDDGPVTDQSFQSHVPTSQHSFTPLWSPNPQHNYGHFLDPRDIPDIPMYRHSHVPSSRDSESSSNRSSMSPAPYLDSDQSSVSDIDELGGSFHGELPRTSPTDSSNSGDTARAVSPEGGDLGQMIYLTQGLDLAHEGVGPDGNVPAGGFAFYGDGTSTDYVRDLRDPQGQAAHYPRDTATSSLAGGSRFSDETWDIETYQEGKAEPLRMVSTPAGLLASAARRKNPSELGAHICPYSDCGRDFTAKHNLEHHMNSHRGIKPYSCGKCGQTFTAPHTRTRHERDTCGIGKPYAKKSKRSKRTA